MDCVLQAEGLRTTKVISGTMPKWQQNFHTFSFGVMCFLFGGFSLFSLRFLIHAWEVHPSKGLVLISVVFFAIVGFGIGMQLWFRRRIVKEFSYDGRALLVRTLGRAEIQTLDLSELAHLGEWRGRGGPLGYRLRFRDGEKVYLQYGVSNCVAAAEQIRSDLRM